MKVVYNGKEYIKLNKKWYDTSYILITEYDLQRKLDTYVKENKDNLIMDIYDIDRQVIFKYVPINSSIERNEISEKILYTFKYEDETNFGFFISAFKNKYKNLKLEDIIFCVAPGAESVEKNEGNLENFVIKIGKLCNCEVQIDLLLRKYSVEKTAFIKKEDRDFEKQYERQYNSIRVNEKFDVKGKEILIIDDIKVTGGTMTACRDILLKEGAKRVYTFYISETF